ncbi:MAG: hypothetical protein BWX96_02184 [Bacteroidetes bacterium ADurb.Bin145]|nr:MAG: hypothetical protein BWX96_02184 [Bacteroidetes bacterium ADurb.Bin145]
MSLVRYSASFLMKCTMKCACILSFPQISADLPLQPLRGRTIMRESSSATILYRLRRILIGRTIASSRLRPLVLSPVPLHGTSSRSLPRISSVFRSRFTGFRLFVPQLPTSDFRLPTSDFRLPTSNLQPSNNNIPLS